MWKTLCSSWHIVGTKNIQIFLLTSHPPLYPSVTAQRNFLAALGPVLTLSLVLLGTNTKPSPPLRGLALLWLLAGALLFLGSGG